MPRHKNLEREDFDEIKRYISQGYKTNKIQILTDRGRSTIAYAVKFDNYDQYRTYVTDRNRRSRLQRSHPHLIAIPKDGPTTDQLIEQLDQQFEALKETMIKVVIATVKIRTEEVTKAHEVELASYKTVVEAAKKNNLVTSLKQALMGGEN